MTEPIVFSYGGGTNSTALLIWMKRNGLRPALTMFANTGDENPHTYVHLDLMQVWCFNNGFPFITVVKNDLPQGVLDGSLYGECVRLGTMPAKVFGRSNCSIKWKIEPQRKYQKTWMREHGIDHVEHFIGYDADEIHRSQKGDFSQSYETLRYPLIEAGWGRDECIQAILDEGLKQPGKSACFHCPSSKKIEVIELRRRYPDLYEKAIVMERRSLAGEGQAPAARVKGLGRHFNWETLEGNDVATPEPCGVCFDESRE